MNSQLYECLPQSVGKRRVHFHAFMIDVHKRLHRISSNAESTGISKKGDAIVPVARELAKEGRVLCFDEFQVTDIADAMILRRLMESMLGYGFIIIITSKWVRFLPLEGLKMSEYTVLTNKHSMFCLRPYTTMFTLPFYPSSTFLQSRTERSLQERHPKRFFPTLYLPHTIPFQRKRSRFRNRLPQNSQSTK